MSNTSDTIQEGNGVPTDRQHVVDLLADEFPDRVYSVEDGIVWVSGMNAHCRYVAERMARTLVSAGIPASLVYDDGAARFGGVEFRYGGAA